MTGAASASRRMAVLAAVAAPFVAGTTLGAIRFVSDEVDSLTITTLRLGIGAVLLLPLALAFARGWPASPPVFWRPTGNFGTMG